MRPRAANATNTKPVPPSRSVPVLLFRLAVTAYSLLVLLLCLGFDVRLRQLDNHPRQTPNISWPPPHAANTQRPFVPSKCPAHTIPSFQLRVLRKRSDLVPLYATY